MYEYDKLMTINQSLFAKHLRILPAKTLPKFAP